MSASEEKRRKWLAEIHRCIPACAEWEEWLARTGELPPDFEEMTSCADLPDPLARTVDGKTVRVKSAKEWAERRQELKGLVQQWLIGKAPGRPTNMKSEVVEEHEENGARVRHVVLTFGPGGKGRVQAEVMIPAGKGPFPIFMTQWNHRGWALIALRRGYVGCVYAGTDGTDDTGTFVEAYPEYDWSKLVRRAWAGSRCLDYLEGVPEADTKRACITGHSRNGKQSLIAGALDERFAVVVSSSAGAGGDVTVRAFPETVFGELIDPVTRGHMDWFHPRLRFFIGREQKLPTDFHHVAALIAPRPLLLTLGANDACIDAHAQERTWRSLKPVWDLLGKGENLRIGWRWGSHDTQTSTIERYLDWCDNIFRGGEYEFGEETFYPHGWETWRKRARIEKEAKDFPKRDVGEVLKSKDGDVVHTAKEWEGRREEIGQGVRWMLGAQPPEVKNPGHDYGLESAYRAELYYRAEVPADVDKDRVMVGEYINMDVFAPKGLATSGKTQATMLYLGPTNCRTGYVEVDCGREWWWWTVSQAGFVFASMDAIGTGGRLEEVGLFYERHPDWSLMGKMVRDARAALEVVRELPYVDAERIYVCGFAMGAMTALHLAAMEERFAGLITLCPPAPFRMDGDEYETGGLRRWSHTEMILPRMGLFIGEEERVPYDVDELMACAAPKAQLVISPKLNHEAPVERVAHAVAGAREVYEMLGAGQKLEHLATDDHACFSVESERLILDWMKRESSRKIERAR